MGAFGRGLKPETTARKGRDYLGLSLFCHKYLPFISFSPLLNAAFESHGKSWSRIFVGMRRAQAKMNGRIACELMIRRSRLTIDAMHVIVYLGLPCSLPSMPFFPSS